MQGAIPPPKGDDLDVNTATACFGTFDFALDLPTYERSPRGTELIDAFITKIKQNHLGIEITIHRDWKYCQYILIPRYTKFKLTPYVNSILETPDGWITEPWTCFAEVIPAIREYPTGIVVSFYKPASSLSAFWWN